MIPVIDNPNQLVFLGLGGLAALAALGVVALNNPVRSALALIVNFFVLAFIYFTLGAQMLGITQILVYTGAIMVLFLFVIMLLNLAAPTMQEQKKDRKVVLGIGLGVGLLGILMTQVVMPHGIISTPLANDAYGTPQAIGKTLFTNYAWPFEVTSILLLVGIVGSIMLAKRRL